MSRRICPLRALPLCVEVIAALVFAASASAAPTDYTFVDLHSPAAGAISMGSAIGDGQQVGLGTSPTNGASRALLWSGSAASVVNLNPAAAQSSQAVGVSGGKQVGYVDFTGNEQHAVIWSGTAASFVDIHPAGYAESTAIRIHVNDIVGTGNDHALLWTGPAHTFTDLHPEGFVSSSVNDVFAGRQGGSAALSGTGPSHALVWSGSAENYVDLHPDGFQSSGITGLSDTQEVGVGWSDPSDQTSHALLWSGTAASFIDLHPAGFDASFGQDVVGGVQVGFGHTQGTVHALAWSGSAASVIDLHSFLPDTYFASAARGIDADGNIIGYARVGGVDGAQHAVMWVPVPDPA
jgi:hypothetical protein